MWGGLYEINTMKEENPVALRLGVSNMWAPSFYSVTSFFDTNTRFAILFRKFFFSVFSNALHYAIINPVVVDSGEAFIVYFYFYQTDISHRYSVIKSRRQKRFSVRAGSRLAYSNPSRLSNVGGVLNLNRRKKYGTIRLLRLRTLFVFNDKSLYTPQEVRRHRERQHKLYCRRQHIKMLSRIYARKFKLYIEKTFLRVVSKKTRCYFKNIFLLIQSSKSVKETYRAYLIYNKFFYYKRNSNYIDAINIILLTLKYRAPAVIISFMARELRKNRFHNRFLKMLKKIIFEFYENTKICTALRLLLKGPINRHGRTKTVAFQFGPIPTQVFTKRITYFNFYSNTKFGTVGVRFWVV